MNLSTLYSGANAPYMRFTDTKSSGTAGTQYTQGAYQTITLNTENEDTTAIATLSNSQFQIPAGTYAVKVSGPATANLDLTYQLRIRTTGNTTLIKWPAHRSFYAATFAGGAPAATGGEGVQLEGRFKINSTTTAELQIDVSGNWTPAAASDGENEVYWMLELLKVA